MRRPVLALALAKPGTGRTHGRSRCVYSRRRASACWPRTAPRSPACRRSERQGRPPMALRFAAAALAAILLAWPAAARMVTDSAGRTVELPEEITRVFAAGPPAAIMLHAMKPEALLGWPRALREEERRYIAAPYRDLPETGRLTGRGGEANLERVLALEPDLILDFGSVRDTYADLADRVQAQTGIPYVLIDGRFEATPASLRLVAEVLGVPE